MNYIFLDTNIFIHFEYFEQIDWKDIVDSKEEISITLAPIVIDELDKHKYNKNQKVSGRVRSLLPKIEKFIISPTLCKYPFKFISNKPSDETFQVNRLDRGDQDDNLLCTIIEFSQSISSVDKVFYITNDVGPRIKSKSFGISALKMPEQYLLKEEPDILEKKNIELQKELSELKKQMPDVHILFQNKERKTSFKREKVITKEEFIANKIASEKRKFQPMVYSENPTRTSLRFGISESLKVTKQQVEQYNAYLCDYFEDYKIYATYLFQDYIFKVNSIEIELLIENIGTVPAVDIDIDIHFPDGFELLASAPHNARSHPYPPKRPQSRLDIITDFAFSGVAVPLPFRNSSIIERNLSNPKIEKTNSYNVNYHLKSLKHNHFEKLDTLYVKFSDIEIAKGFTLDYSLKISNVPKILTGQLYVILE